MAFSFSVNQSPTTGARAMYLLIAKLIAQGWVKVADSDGTTYSAAGTQVTSGATGANGLDNSKAWVELKRPDNGAAMTIQRSTGGGTDWRVKYVEGAASFNAGSPDATTTPSHANEGIWIGAGTDAAPTFRTIFTTDNTYKVQLGADGASPYGFWLCTYTAVGNAPDAGLVYDPLTSCAPGETSPYILHAAGTSTGAFTAATICTTSTQWGSKGYVGSIAAANFLQIPGAQLQIPSGNTLFPFNAGVNPITSKDDGFPIPFGRNLNMTAPNGFKGVSTLMRWMGTQRAHTGDTAALSAAKDRIILEAVSLPWDGATNPN